MASQFQPRPIRAPAFGFARDHQVTLEEEETVLAVTTRAQRKKANTEDDEESENLDAEAEAPEEEAAKCPDLLEQSPEEAAEQSPAAECPDLSPEDLLGQEFLFEEDMFEKSPKTKIHASRSEKREHNLKWSKRTDDGDTRQLRTDQEKDPEVQRWMQQEDPTRIIRKGGVLCRVWTPRDSPGVVYEQIVLPKQYRSEVIKLAHDIPLSGHLGREKTAKRILRRFYWPTLFRDVKQHCQTCEECQLHGAKAPMIPLPVIGEPFKRIAMDIVGPLPRTGRGNRFILVVSDYATRYPEAIPLRNITAPKIAEVLVELFSRYGIPEEILTDQGTNFTSKLFGELYRLIGVQAIRTSPYHPQTDGLVERFNRTLKSMLRTVLDGEKRNWDLMLPHVLFAYREVPQATLGFSPFELLYGRDVRGPLDVLKEEWIQNPETEADVLSFVMEVKNQMELAKEQTKQKEYYDQRRWT